MAEKSGGNPDQESALTTWQCIHYGTQVPRMTVGYIMKYCFMCGKAQIMCVNPDCKEPFEKEMEECSKCHTPQRQPPESSPMEVQILCINPDCKAPLDSVSSEICMKCSAPQQKKNFHPVDHRPCAAVQTVRNLWIVVKPSSVVSVMPYKKSSPWKHRWYVSIPLVKSHYQIWKQRCAPNARHLRLCVSTQNVKLLYSPRNMP